MPGYELLGREELEAIKQIFNEKPVLFAHGFDNVRRAYHVRDFEKALEKQFDSKHAVCVSSGTAAIKIALKALGVKAGDEVITQGFNFIATVEAIHDIGAIPIITDVDSTLNMCPKSLKEKINKKTRAIIPVHMLGVPARFRPRCKLSRSRRRCPRSRTRPRRSRQLDPLRQRWRCFARSCTWRSASRG